MTTRELINALHSNAVVAVKFNNDEATLGKLEDVDATTGWATVSQGGGLTYRTDDYPIDRLTIEATM